MDDSNITRTQFDTKPIPVVRYTIQPHECGAFHPPTGLNEVLEDLSLSFAAGMVPLTGETGPTTAIRLTIRSAERERPIKADFD